MTASLPAVFNVQLLTDTGAPASGFRLYTYSPGTTVHKVAYTDAAATIPHTYTSDGVGGQFIALNSRGELPAGLYLTDGGYDLALKNPAGATVWTRRADGIAASASGLDDYTDAGKGAGLVGFSAALSYAANTVGAALKNAVSAVAGKITQSRFEATATDDSGTPDAAVRVSRTLAAPSTAAGHAFRDQTNSDRLDTSYCSFDAAGSMRAAGTTNHYAGFQSRPSIQANTKYLYNLTSSPTVEAGATLTNNYGLYPYNPTGAGTVEYNYGVYVPSQTKGTLGNWPLYIANQPGLAYIGAETQILNLLRVGLNSQLMLGNSDGNDYPHVAYNFNFVTGTYVASDVAMTMYMDATGFRFRSAASGTAGAACTLSDLMRVKLTGAINIVPRAAAPSSAVAGDLYFDSGLAKLRCYDGSAWQNLW